MHHDRTGGREDAGPFCRVAVDHLVGVHPLGQGRHAQVGLQAGFVAEQSARVEGQLVAVVHGLAGRFQPAQGRLLTGGIGIQGQDDAAGKALEQPSWSSVRAVPIGETVFVKPAWWRAITSR